VYSGVLHEALGMTGLDTATRRRAVRTLVVVCALFGALRLTDRIPAYRLPGDTVLPGSGPIMLAWRDPLEQVIPRAVGRGLFVDLRSSKYAALWQPAPALAARTVVVRIVQQRRVAGATTRTVVSHSNKATKGRLARALLLDGADPRTAAQFVDACMAVGFVAEPEPPPPAGRPHRVNVVVPDRPPPRVPAAAAIAPGPVLRQDRPRVAR